MEEPKLNIYRTVKSWSREEERLNKADISPRNKELIRQYINEKFALGLSQARCVKLSAQMRKISALTDKDFDKVTKEDILSILTKINTDLMVEKEIRNFYSGKIFYIKGGALSLETKRDYWRIVKSFFKWVNKENRIFFEDIKFNTKDKPNKTVGDIITEEDIKKVLENANNIRDRAILAVLHETGARAGELLTLRVRDIIKWDKFFKLRLNGKTGERNVPIVWSIPYLLRYLDNHPFKHNPDSWLWLSDHPRFRNQPLLHPGLRILVKRNFVASGLGTKRCNPHFFRHSRATINAMFMTDTQLSLYFGWVIGTGQVATYVHASGRDMDDAVLKMHGIKKEEYISVNQAKTCAICKTVNEGISDFCKNCGHPLTLKTAIAMEDKMKKETDKVFELLMEITKNPKMLEEFEEYKKMCITQS